MNRRRTHKGVNDLYMPPVPDEPGAEPSGGYPSVDLEGDAAQAVLHSHDLSGLDVTEAQWLV